MKVITVDARLQRVLSSIRRAHSSRSSTHPDNDLSVDTGSEAFIVGFALGFAKSAGATLQPAHQDVSEQLLHDPTVRKAFEYFAPMDVLADNS